MTWIGIDDTDSREGGCTTYVAYQLIKKLSEYGFNIVGYPRLIRLNPNIPWKTRGNGAIVLKVERRHQSNHIIGDKEISSFRKKSSKDLIEIIEDVIERYTMFNGENTNPGYVALEEQPPYDIYLKAVREVVSLKTIEEELKSTSEFWKGYGNKRGLIGAFSAAAWRPKNDRTFELIAYRYKNRWGTSRFVDEKSVIEMDRKCLTTFDNYDYINNYVAIAPHSPCPVLYGIRGEDTKELIHAKSLIKSEKVYGWLIFETNQATDEHLQEKKIRDIKPFESVIVTGKISSIPKTIQGGHVFFSLSDETGCIECAAYEPTKNFRVIIRKLLPGDIISVYGGVRDIPLTINIEKIKVIKLIDVFEKIGNPICPRCGRRMKSKGRNQGYKCKVCGLETKKAPMKKKIRDIKPGFYEVPVCARRHLSKPLKRINRT